MKKGKNILRPLWSFIAGHKILFMIALVLIIFQPLLLVAVAECFRRIADSLSAHSMDVLVHNIIIGMAVFIGSIIISWVIDIFTQYLSGLLTRETRLKAVAHVNTIPLLEYEKMNTGNLHSILKDDIDQASAIVPVGMYNLLLNIFTFLFAFLYLMYLDLKLVLVVLAGSIVMAVINLVFNSRIKHSYMRARNDAGAFQDFLVNNIENQNLINAYSAESFMQQRFRKLRQRLFKSNLGAFIFSRTQDGLLFLMTIILMFGSGFYLGFRAIEGLATIGTVMAFTNLVTKIVAPLRDIFVARGTLQPILAAWERINTIFSIEQEEYDRTATQANTGKPVTTAAFENISFSYTADKKIISAASLHLELGKVYGIVGKSGTGKSTLLKIMTGLYASDSMQASFNSRIVSRSECRDNISFVPAEPVFFAKSIRENLLPPGSNGSSMEILEKQISLLGAGGFISRLPQGFDTLLNENALNLSGGERKQLAILRALAADRPMLFMDEPFANIEKRIEEKILEFITQLKKSKIILFTTHRLDPLSVCDIVYELSEDGQITRKNRQATV